MKEFIKFVEEEAFSLTIECTSTQLNDIYGLLESYKKQLMGSDKIKKLTIDADKWELLDDEIGSLHTDSDLDEIGEIAQRHLGYE